MNDGPMAWWMCEWADLLVVDGGNDGYVNSVSMDGGWWIVEGGGWRVDGGCS